MTPEPNEKPKPRSEPTAPAHRPVAQDHDRGWFWKVLETLDDIRDWIMFWR